MGNKCCRIGWKGGEKGCDVEEGGNNYHTCVSGQSKSTIDRKTILLKCNSDTTALVSSAISAVDPDMFHNQIT